jgi:hypothetical protein
LYTAIQAQRDLKMTAFNSTTDFSVFEIPNIPSCPLQLASNSPILQGNRHDPLYTVFFFLISKRGFIKKRKAQSSTHGYTRRFLISKPYN